LKELEGIKIGPFGSSLKLDTLSESGIKVYGQGNVIKDDFSLGERYIPLNRFESDFSQYEISEGDVLVTMMGTTGKCKVFSKDFERGILDSHLLRLRFDKTKFNSQLFSVILEQSNYLYNQIKLMSKGSIMEGLNSSIVKELFIFTPSIEEQSEILKYLNSKTKEIDDLVQLEQKKIDLLKEYRQSLISEVITGKIKVTTDE
jgi:type I restriction enzyme S subunit